ncbi:MAG TPA: hypothetical protein VM183_09665 [Burkholderiales bacterium]|nr:hypothetical protein [Burkholderiales bacterium]
MMNLCRLLFFCLAAASASGAAADDARAAFYSFSDLYRLTVNGTLPEVDGYPVATPEPQVRVASAQAAPATELRFTISPVPGPGRWMLILAGLAAAAWVAHRRLTRPF